MLKSNLFYSNFKLNFRRYVNRFLFFFPFGENLLNQKILLVLFVFIFGVYNFILYHLVELIIPYFSQAAVLLVNLLVLWNLISNLRSSHDILQRFVYPEDFLLLYSVKTDPNDILLVRFFTQIIFKSLFSTLFFLYPILFYVLNFAEESITSRLLLFVSFPFYVLFLIGVISFYSSGLYIIYSKFLHVVFQSAVKSVLSFVFVMLLSFLSTTVFGWLGFSYFYEENFIESIIHSISRFNLDVILTGYVLPTNWLFNTLMEVDYFIYYQPLLLIIGIILIYISFLIVNKYLDVKDMSQLSNEKTNVNIIKNRSFPNFVYRKLKKLLSRKVLAVMKKDFIAFTRANFLIKKRFYLSIYMLASEIGLLLGLGMMQNWFEFPAFFVIYPIIFAVSINVSFLGDGLLGITSADAERENLFLYKGSGSSLNQLIVSKAILHVIPILIVMNVLFICVVSFFHLKLSTVIMIFVLVNTTAIIISSAQIIGTFLYPRLDWEHIEDVGSSVKASVFEHTILGIVLILNLEIYGLLGVLYWKNYISSILFNVLAILGSFLLLISFFIFFYFWINRVGTSHWEMSR